MNLIDSAAEFVKKLNSLLKNLYNNDKETISKLKLLISRIINIRDKLTCAESKLVSMILKYENVQEKEDEIYYLKHNGVIKAILSKNIINIKPSAITKNKFECICELTEHVIFNSIKELIIVDSESLLHKIDVTFKNVIIEVFDHDYRSFNGFACWISVLTVDGMLYIIDCLKYREIIPKLRLLKCGVNKIIHCRNCVDRLNKDFGSIGCYKNLKNYNESEIYIDWRIRPINRVFIDMINESMENTIKECNKMYCLEKYESGYRNMFNEFIENYKLDSDCPFLYELLDLRIYVAQMYDESVEYVMTDDQLYKIIKEKPTTVEEFDNMFDRMSSAARLHAGDFLLVLKRKLNGFSIDKLKEKKNKN